MAPHPTAARTLTAAAVCAVAMSAAAPAHVLFIVVDDLGFSDVGYKKAMYNLSGPAFATPTLDALALAGVRLESYYVHALCSPSRTAFLSGRYAYTTGMNAEVIQDGHPDQLDPTIRTLADLLKIANWSTAAFGKQDYGMTSWGCTPTCRGFDTFSGFYNALETYFTHMVGAGLDLRRDFTPDVNQSGVYSTSLFAMRASEWIQAAVASGAKNTFGYLAFQAIHAPQQAPQAYVDGYCTTAIPASQPVRRIACAQMRAVDDGVATVIAAYKAAGIWDDTLLIFTADNGGNTDTGGSNAPLRGAKATMYEGGMRAAAFVSGAGLAPTVRGTISHELYSLVDWLPTIAGAIAGVPLAEAELPKRPGQPSPPPLDGVDVWDSLSAGAPSPRTSALLWLDPYACFDGVGVGCTVPGEGAIRVGRYKLIHGHVGIYMGQDTNVTTQFCGARDGDRPATLPPTNVTLATAPPFCPAGWVQLDGSVAPPPEHAGTGSACASTPCRLPGSSPLLSGGTFLFDVVDDMREEHDLAASMPDMVAELLALLQAINSTNVPQSNSAVDPASNPAHFGGVWTPWRGNPDPSLCDPNVTAGAASGVVSRFDGAVWPSQGVGGSVILRGWAWSPTAPDGDNLLIALTLDGVELGTVSAALRLDSRKTEVDENHLFDHGFEFALTPQQRKALEAPGRHVITARFFDASMQQEQQRHLTGSPRCISARHRVRCSRVD